MFVPPPVPPLAPSSVKINEQGVTKPGFQERSIKRTEYDPRVGSRRGSEVSYKDMVTGKIR